MNDARFMQRALELARQGVGLASPNPCVGAVVVNDDGQIIGEGTHTYEGRKHAEVIALEQAGSAAAGATLYLTLEPCSHTGRTGPCADAVIAARIRRVVAAMRDPNPVVAGNGFRKLRDAGVAVDAGLGEQEARKINEAFAKFIRTRRPFVTLKAAMTLDGRIAPPASLRSSKGSPFWITGELARNHVQGLRHATDAILVGVGTVVADDPLLTDRTGLPRRRPLLRIVLDSTLRIPLDSKLVETANQDVLVFCTSPNNAKLEALRAKGVCVERVEADFSGRPSFSPVLDHLGEMGILSLIVEGGASVNCQAIASGIVDKVFFYYAPILFGASAVPFLAGGENDAFGPIHIKNLEVHRFGDDFAIEGYLRDPYDEKGV